MAVGGAEEHFAKKLANNEKIIRDRAVNKLRAWIRSRPKDGTGTVIVNYKKTRACRKRIKTENSVCCAGWPCFKLASASFRLRLLKPN